MAEMDWQNATNYFDTVGTTLKTFSFNKTQNLVQVTNKGNADITYTIGSQSGTLSAGQTKSVSEKISSFNLTSTSGTQSVFVWATEDGTKKIDSGLLESKWVDKVWTLHGDSITWYDGNLYPSSTALCNGYPSVANKTMRIKTLRNIAVSGASMAKSPTYPTNGSIYVTGSNYPTVSYYDVDITTIFAGTNDFKLNVPLGTIGLDSDTTWDDTTFYGAYRHLIEAIISQNPNTKIYLFTPIQRNNAGYDCNFTNTAGFKLIDYVNAVKSIGQMYGIAVLDLYSLSGITRKTLTNYTIDSLHPNDAGHARIADLVRHFIEQY